MNGSLSPGDASDFQFCPRAQNLHLSLRQFYLCEKARPLNKVAKRKDFCQYLSAGISTGMNDQAALLPVGMAGLIREETHPDPIPTDRDREYAFGIVVR